MAFRIDAKTIARLGLLLGCALVLQWLESLLPYIIPFAPIRVGFANIAVLYTLKNYGKSAACIVAILRCVMFALILGRMSSLLYSLAGTLISLCLMCLLISNRHISLFGVSVAGAFGFNLGQLGVGLLIIGEGIFPFAPIFSLISIPCGLITALLGNRIPRL